MEKRICRLGIVQRMFVQSIFKKVLRIGFGTALLLGVCSLWACSSVGPGFANHPIDCALGIAWADCLPGTLGYRGGDQLARAEQDKTLAAARNAYQAQCNSAMQHPEIDAIREKVELSFEAETTVPPFTIAVNDTFPTASEKPAIAKWAAIREDCIKNFSAAASAMGTTLQTVLSQQSQSYWREANGRVSALIVALYQAKLTYGEFAQKRYEMHRDGEAAQRQFRAATLIADQKRQVQEEQLAQQQIQNNLAAWSTYMREVNARRPETVHCQGLSGGIVDISCTSH